MIYLIGAFVRHRLICTFSHIVATLATMSEISVTEARTKLADVVDDARVSHTPVYLTRRGKRIAAVVDADDLDQLLRDAEDAADIAAAAQARDGLAGGDVSIPWDEVKADLGV